MFQLIKGLLFLGTVILVFICGLNVEHFLTIEMLQQSSAAEKLVLLDLGKEKMFIIGVTTIIFLLILVGTHLVGFFSLRKLHKDLKDEKKTVKNQYLSYTSLEKDHIALNKELQEVTSNKRYIDDSVAKLTEVANVGPDLLKGIVNNSQMLEKVVSMLPSHLSDSSGLSVQKIVADLDLASTMKQIKDAEVNEDLDFNYSEAVDLLLSLEQKFGIDSKEFVVMAWVISNIMYESHHGITAGFAKQLKQRTEKIFPVLKQNEEDDDFLDEIFISFEK